MPSPKSFLPKNMALFSRYDLDRNVVTVDLPPSCESVALAIGAKVCEPPANENLSLLYGHQDAKSVLFA